MMIFDKVNVIKELQRERDLQLLNNARSILEQEAARDKDIIVRLSDGNGGEQEISIRGNENIYSFSQIEKICITYRLRFLDSKHYRKEFPYDAIVKVKEFEKHYNTTIRKFKIIAPEKAFELEDCHQDPLLFAQLSDNKFMLIHQWGNDLAWYRKYIYFPIRNIYTYFYFMLAVAALFAFSVPFSWFNVEPDNIIYMRVWLTVHSFIGIFFICIFFGSILQTGFSSMIWKSKYMNE